MIERNGWILNFEMASIITTMAMIKTIMRANPDINAS
jgi:hypothetical protein